MKNFVRLSFVLLACLGSMVFGGPAGAATVWTSTFEAGDLSEWTSPSINLTKGTRKNFQVLSEQVYTGKLAGKITVHPDDTLAPYNQDRVDIGHVSTLSDEGKDSWLSGHYFMPADANVRNEFGWYESQSYKNVMDFWVQPKTGGGTSISFGVGFLGATVLWTGDFSIGKWHQVAIHVHWSTNANLGSVDVWFDGIQVVTAKKAQTKADANRLFYQTGLHRTSPANFVDTIYFDDFIEADTQDEAKIAAPSSTGDAGVTPTDAGMTGAAGGSGAAAAGAAGTSGAAGSTRAAGAGTTGAAGANTTGAAGSVMGAAGATGAAGSPIGAAGTTGAAGSTTGAAGTSATGTAGRGASGSSGCTYAAIPRDAGSFGALVLSGLVGVVIARRGRRK